MNGLAHTRIKTVRAKEHMDALYREINLFIASEPVAITEHDDIENGVHVIRFEDKVIPNIIPLLVGEIGLQPAIRTRPARVATRPVERRHPLL